MKNLESFLLWFFGILLVSRSGIVFIEDGLIWGGVVAFIGALMTLLPFLAKLEEVRK